MMEMRKRVVIAGLGDSGQSRIVRRGIYRGVRDNRTSGCDASIT